jgi:hypothetical protein
MAELLRLCKCRRPIPRRTTAAKSGAQACLDQEARSTLTTLNRGSRSTWMFKAKPTGQAVNARRSATVFAVTAIPVVTSTRMLSRYPRKSFCMSSIVLTEYRTPVLAQGRIHGNVSAVVEPSEVVAMAGMVKSPFLGLDFRSRSSTREERAKNSAALQ